MDDLPKAADDGQDLREFNVKTSPLTDSEPQSQGSRQRGRTDRKRFHAIRHGVLSRHPLAALAHAGENIRQLRGIERKLRAELNPQGIVAEILFDRAWSSFLRCLLIARTEGELVTPIEKLMGRPSPPRLQQGPMPTLVFSEPVAATDLHSDLITHLGTVVRYDAHFSREFYRAVGLLLAMRSGGDSGLTGMLVKTAGANKEFLEDPNG